MRKKRKKAKSGFSVAAALFAAVFLTFLLWPRIFHETKKMTHPLKYFELVEKYSSEYGVPIELCFAVIRTESGFDDRALSKAGAKGLMQLTDATAKWVALKLGVSDYDIFSPETNIRFGTWLLSKNLADFSGEKEALAAYNAGRERVKEWLSDKDYSQDGKTLSVIPYPETENYVKKVRQAAEIYKDIYFTEEDK